MKASQHFSWTRFWLLLRLEVFKSRKAMGMIFVITFGMLFFLGLLLALLVDVHVVNYDHHENYASSLIIGGFIISSLAFSDLGNQLKRYRYLMLPVSALEKFTCMWLLTSIGWILLYTLIFTIYTWIANPVGQLLFSRVTFESFNPFSGFSWHIMKVYFVLQGIFLVGAVHFKGYVLPKTLFVLVLVSLITGTLIYFILKDVFLADHYCTNEECELVIEMGTHPIWQAAQWMFWWVLAPLTWVITYLGLKGQEV